MVGGARARRGRDAPAAPRPRRSRPALVALHLPAPGCRWRRARSRGRGRSRSRGRRRPALGAAGCSRPVRQRCEPGSLLDQPGQWDIALGGIEHAFAAPVESSVPYLRADPVGAHAGRVAAPADAGRPPAEVSLAVTGSRGAAAARRVRTPFAQLLVAWGMPSSSSSCRPGDATPRCGKGHCSAWRCAVSAGAMGRSAGVSTPTCAWVLHCRMAARSAVGSTVPSARCAQTGRSSGLRDLARLRASGLRVLR